MKTQLLSWLLPCALLLAPAAPLGAQLTTQCEQDLITAAEPINGSQFGRSVAISGQTALVGAFSGSGGGQAYVYERTSSGWVQTQKLVPAGLASGDSFGYAVGLSGETALVTARGDKDNGFGSGAAYIFRKHAGSWVEVTKLLASDGGPEDNFGLACSLDGATCVIGAPGDDQGAANAGAAYVFEFNGSAWVETRKLVQADAEPKDVFGAAVSVSGTTILVGAAKDDDGNPTDPNWDSGSAYFYEKFSAEWEPMQKVTASNTAFDDLFGISVAVHNELAVIGSTLHDTGGMNNAGMAYVLERQDNGTVDDPTDDFWIELDTVIAVDGAADDLFGQSVAIWGGRVVVGADRHDGVAANTGSAYLFERSHPSLPSWLPKEVLVPDEAAFDDRYGLSVAVWGNHVMAGSTASDQVGENTGAVATWCFTDLLYVRKEAAGFADGSSWADAYPEVQDALVHAVAGDTIWVAVGTYHPDDGDGQTPGDRLTSFQLVSGVKMYGGFLGTETTLDERAGLFTETILSGDLEDNDGGDFLGMEENSVHVVNGYQTISTAYLDGFQIRDGNANAGPHSLDGGGGIFNRPGDPTVVNCLITHNTAGSLGNGGGGVYNRLSYATYINCDISYNQNVACCAAAMWNQAGAPRIINCRFYGNETLAGDGGAVGNRASSPIFINCEFSGNVAPAYGGAIYDDALSNSTTINCTFSGNIAGIKGGGIGGNALGASPTIRNSIFWGNRDADGFTESSQIYATHPTVSYCLVQGLTPELDGPGNFDADPLFVDFRGPDNKVGTIDDNVSLSNGSPCIDAGQDEFIPMDSDDLDGDGDVQEPVPLDLAMLPRFSDSPATTPGMALGVSMISDVGAYERVPLIADVDTISVASGGTQSFQLDGGLDQRGRPFILLGTTSGTLPGIDLGSVLLPLNYDGYMQLTLDSPSATLIGSIGVLDQNGHALAQLSLPPLPVSLVGTRFNHAFVTSNGKGAAAFTSNAVQVSLEP
jgi:hypothetical protein